VGANDATTLESVVAVVLGVSVAASLLPAIRAARVDPAETLREE
jgi:ABC-type lipoprotein release transport system permease subunit